MALAREVNQYVSDQAPWALFKSDPQRAGTVLYVALRAIDNLKTIFTPFLPFSLADAARAARSRGLTSPGRSSSATSTRGTRRPHQVLTGDYESWTGDAGRRAGSRRGRRSASRFRCSRSSILIVVVAEDSPRMDGRPQ